MWREKDKDDNYVVYRCKGMTLASMLDSYDTHIRGTEAWIHCRISTGGTVDLDMCHPHIVAGDGDVLLMHNGILSIPEYDRKRSDTSHFAEYLGRILETHQPGEWCDVVRSAPFQDLVDSWCGSDRIVIFDKDGTAGFFGDWVDVDEKYVDGQKGVKASNSGYRWARAVTSKHYGYNSYGYWSQGGFHSYDDWDNEDFASWEKTWDKKEEHDSTQRELEAVFTEMEVGESTITDLEDRFGRDADSRLDEDEEPPKMLTGKHDADESSGSVLEDCITFCIESPEAAGEMLFDALHGADPATLLYRVGDEK